MCKRTLDKLNGVIPAVLAALCPSFPASALCDGQSDSDTRKPARIDCLWRMCRAVDADGDGYLGARDLSFWHKENVPLLGTGGHTPVRLEDLQRQLWDMLHSPDQAGGAFLDQVLGCRRPCVHVHVQPVPNASMPHDAPLPGPHHCAGSSTGADKGFTAVQGEVSLIKLRTSRMGAAVVGILLNLCNLMHNRSTAEWGAECPAVFA